MNINTNNSSNYQNWKIWKLKMVKFSRKWQNPQLKKEKIKRNNSTKMIKTMKIKLSKWITELIDKIILNKTIKSWTESWLKRSIFRVWYQRISLQWNNFCSDKFFSVVSHFFQCNWFWLRQMIRFSQNIFLWIVFDSNDKFEVWCVDLIFVSFVENEWESTNFLFIQWFMVF